MATKVQKKSIYANNCHKIKNFTLISNEILLKNKFAPFNFLLYLCGRFRKIEVKYTLYILEK